MNLIDQQIEKNKTQGRMLLMTHVVLGYPSLEESEKIIVAMARAGADLIELQIPFSDPLGDGEVIRKANTIALENGFKVEQAFELVKRLRQKHQIKIPLLFMTYFNIVLSYGVEKFCKQADQVGINGLIIPDYSVTAEKHDKLNKFCQQHNLYLINFLSLDSSQSHIKHISKNSQGFVYCFAQRGVTGSRQELLEGLNLKLLEFGKQIKTPLAIGFGLSQPEHILDLKGKADVVIVGSALLNAYNQGGLSELRQQLENLCSVL